MDSIVGFTPPADRVPTTARHSLRSVTALRSAASALARSNAPTSVLALRRRPRPAIWPSRHLLDPSCRQFASFHAAKAAHRELLRPRTSYGARSRIASCCPCPPPYQCNVPVGQPAPRSMALRRTSVVNASSRIRPHTGRRAIRRFNPHPRVGDEAQVCSHHAPTSDNAGNCLPCALLNCSRSFSVPAALEQNVRACGDRRRPHATAALPFGCVPGHG